MESGEIIDHSLHQRRQQASYYKFVNILYKRHKINIIDKVIISSLPQLTEKLLLIYRSTIEGLEKMVYYFKPGKKA